jgi:hypothetical protein
MKQHLDWKTPYLRAPRIRFALDTRQGRRRARLRRLAARIFCFAVALTLGIYALGWALGNAPTLQ